MTEIKLTADELQAAKAAGMTAEEYENYKSPQPKLPPKAKRGPA
jgi:hypothetical protein